jgi:hypothetical protein
MFGPKYTLEVISKHKDFNNKPLKQYNVDGINTVGAWGSEPFEIRFNNHTYEKVQVKISLDGTDILSGDIADTEVSEKMWLVNGCSTLTLKAWAESVDGGAQFVFTNANNSVAVHTHGNLSSRGIIAAAVFVEGQPDQVRIDHHYHHYDYVPYSWWYYRPILIPNTTTYYNNDNICRSRRSISTKCCDSVSINNFSTLDCNAAGASSSINLTSEQNTSTNLESLASVGAGDYVNQKISYVKGLNKPLFTETVRVRYLWWDCLKEKLLKSEDQYPHASGFPGDKPNKMANIGNTPRIKTGKKHAGCFRRSDQDVFTRF